MKIFKILSIGAMILSLAAGPVYSQTEWPEGSFEYQAIEYLADMLRVDPDKITLAGSVDLTLPYLPASIEFGETRVAILEYEGKEYYIKGDAAGLQPIPLEWALEQMDARNPLVGAAKAKLQLMDALGVGDDVLRYEGYEVLPSLTIIDSVYSYKVFFRDIGENLHTVISTYDSRNEAWTIEIVPLTFEDLARGFLARELGVPVTEIMPVGSADLTPLFMPASIEFSERRVAILEHGGKEYYIKGEIGLGPTPTGWLLTRMEVGDPLAGAAKAKLQLLKELDLSDSNLRYVSHDKINLPHDPRYTDTYIVRFEDIDTGDPYAVITIYNARDGSWTIKTDPRAFDDRVREVIAAWCQLKFWMAPDETIIDIAYWTNELRTKTVQEVEQAALISYDFTGMAEKAITEACNIKFGIAPDTTIVDMAYWTNELRLGTAEEVVQAALVSDDFDGMANIVITNMYQSELKMDPSRDAASYWTDYMRQLTRTMNHVEDDFLVSSYYGTPNGRIEGHVLVKPDEYKSLYYHYIDEDYQGRGYGRMDVKILARADNDGATAYHYEYLLDGGYKKHCYATSDYSNPSDPVLTDYITTYEYDATGELVSNQIQGDLTVLQQRAVIAAQQLQAQTSSPQEPTGVGTAIAPQQQP